MNWKKFLKDNLDNLIGVSFGTLILYSCIVWSTEELNPFTENAKQRMNQRAKIERQAYQENYEKIFGPNSYADVDRNGIIDFKEGLDAYRRMKGNILSGDIFPRSPLGIAEDGPTLSELERAVKSYERGRK